MSLWGQCWLLLPALIMSWKKVTMVRDHRGLSFESALIDGIMSIAEGKQHVLAGAMDEKKGKPCL